jgi:hypothetical protein
MDPALAPGLDEQISCDNREAVAHGEVDFSGKRKARNARRIRKNNSNTVKYIFSSR